MPLTVSAAFLALALMSTAAAPATAEGHSAHVVSQSAPAANCGLAGEEKGHGANRIRLWWCIDAAQNSYFHAGMVKVDAGGEATRGVDTTSHWSHNGARACMDVRSGTWCTEHTG